MGDIYRVLGISGGTITDSGGTETDIPYINQFAINPEVSEIEFEGDGASVTDAYGIKVDGTFGYDKWSEDVLEALFSKTSTDSGTGESKRYYMGEAAELTPTQVQLEFDLSAINDATEAAATIRMTVFKARCKPYTPPDGANKAKWAAHSFSFSSEITSTDIEANALPEVCTGGAHWAISVLS